MAKRARTATITTSSGSHATTDEKDLWLRLNNYGGFPIWYSLFPNDPTAFLGGDEMVLLGAGKEHYIPWRPTLVAIADGGSTALNISCVGNTP